MRIKKTSQTTPIQAQVVNTQSNSTTDSYSCDYVNELNEYSTTETVCGTWINGKPIYRKVIRLTNVSNGELDITSMNIDEFVSCMATQNSGSYVSFFNLFTGSTNINYITFNISNGVTKLVYRQGGTPTIITVILEYTKTTD